MSNPEYQSQEPKVLPGYFSPAAPPPQAPAQQSAPHMPSPVRPYAAPQLQLNPTLGTQPIRGATFMQALGRFYSQYAVFNGRSSRSEYWWIAGATTGLFVVSAILSDITGGDWILGLWAIFMLASLIPSVAVTVRRLHDVNLSGALACLWLVPYVGFIAVWVLAFLPEKAQGARFDK
ncbi:DUF805 domain-containing protein [Arthrobacter psychrolactophilus]|uniref:DUF805 domain-containing protein n=1 Tax=Arthrobacter psychrolactophilus TaxID=92442 RepID=A0A2V5IWA7_9MICC|nr:DUF805 domain-containing protein [Arthrobacter psychrolactophilus]PYI38494.1 DUF805 domain-containing protein [Arthrobacter psychrolactophilus]